MLLFFHHYFYLNMLVFILEHSIQLVTILNVTSRYVKNNVGPTASLEGGRVLICMGDCHLPILISWCRECSRLCLAKAGIVYVQLHGLLQLSWGKTQPFSRFLQPQQSVLIRCRLGSFLPRWKQGLWVLCIPQTQWRAHLVLVNWVKEFCLWGERN